MSRILFLLIITIAMINQYFLISLIIAFVYLFRYRGYELVLLAILIDGFYGAFYTVPWLSIGLFMTMIFVNILKPFLLMYTDRNEMVS